MQDAPPAGGSGADDRPQASLALPAPMLDGSNPLASAPAGATAPASEKASASPAAGQQAPLTVDGSLITLEQGPPTTQMLLSKTVSGGLNPPLVTGEEPHAAGELASSSALRDLARKLAQREPVQRGWGNRPHPATELLAGSGDSGASIPAAPHSAPQALPAVAGSLAAQPGAPFELDSIIDRLVEARQAAVDGKVRISVAHSDFGAVGIRLDHALDARLINAAFTSGDPGFAPAVHAALGERGQAERHQGPGDQPASVRQDQAATRSDTSSQGSGQPGAQRAHSDAERSRPASPPPADPALPQGELVRDLGVDGGGGDPRGLYA